MIEKHATFPGTDTATGMPYIHQVEAGSAYGLSEGWVKSAGVLSHIPQIQTLIESIKPRPGTIYLLNSAIVAGERTGFNARGDWFTREGLRRTPPGWDALPWTIDALDARRKLAASTQPVTGWGSLAWGYPTFLNACRFQNHANLDPQRSRGFILGAFYDERMDRVVLVSELVRSLCEKHGPEATGIYDRIAAGHYPDTSMACRVPYDQCSICGHVARVPRDYCTHAKTQMNAVYPDGRKVGVYNHYPNFFDDSYVFIGAERAAKMMYRYEPEEMRGDRGYARTIYRPGSGAPVRVDVSGAETDTPAQKAASATLSANTLVDGAAAQMSTRRDLYEPQIAEGLLDAVRPRRYDAKKDDVTVLLSEVMRGTPVDSKERDIQRYVARRLSWLAAERDGRRTEADRRTWEQQSRDAMRSQYGMLENEIDLAEARIHEALRRKYLKPDQRGENTTRLPTPDGNESLAPADRGGGQLEKVGDGPITKRAEIIKRLPPAHPGVSSEIARLDDRLVPLPRDILDDVAQIGPFGPQVLLRVGILMSPREWQYTQTRPMLPALADEIFSGGATFRCPMLEDGGDIFPVPSSLECDRPEDAGSPIIARILSRILPWVMQRGLPGSGIRVLRIGVLSQPPDRAPASVIQSELPRPIGATSQDTNKNRTLPEGMSGDGYAKYRRGGLADLPELRYLWQRSADHLDEDTNLWRYLWR